MFFSEANDRQLEAIRATEGPVLIIAGPGSGKTFTLVERVVGRIEAKDFRIAERPARLCKECYMRFYCDKKNWRFRQEG